VISLRVQLLLSHLLLVIAMAIAVSYSVSGLFQTSNRIEDVLRKDFREALAAQKMGAAIREYQVHLWSAATRQDETSRRSAQAAWNEFQSALMDARNSVTDSDKDSGLLRQIGDEAKLYREASQPWLSPSKGHATLLDEVARKLLPRQQALVRLTDELFAANWDDMVAAKEGAKREASQRAVRSLWLTGITLILAIALSYRLVRLALTPLALLAHRAEEIGSGELGGQLAVHRRDEIGALADSFNQMASKLAEVRRSEVRKLQRAERVSDAALESLYDPVIVTDAKGRIYRLNRAAELLFGKAPVSPRVPVADHIRDPRIVRAIESAVTREAVSASEDERGIVSIAVGDQERKFRLRASPMKDDSGNLLGSVVVLEDITHLRELDRLKNEFIGVASHELRTPVTSLLLSVQLLEEGALGELTPAQREVVQVQKADLERLEKLMRDLLDISRLEAGSAPPKFEAVAPSELLQTFVAPLKPQAEKKGVTLDWEAQEEPKAWLDRNQIGRVLINLVNNAIRHTPAGGKVSVRAIPGPDQVTFEVEDTGEGIPPKFLESIFDRFVQVPGATGGGAGLGLSIAKTIVKAHGGELTVQSEVGRGSLFRFTVPTESSSAKEPVA
jgi:signal transduction histidine kinase